MNIQTIKVTKFHNGSIRKLLLQIHPVSELNESVVQLCAQNRFVLQYSWMAFSFLKLISQINHQCPS